MHQPLSVERNFCVERERFAGEWFTRGKVEVFRVVTT